MQTLWMKYSLPLFAPDGDGAGASTAPTPSSLPTETVPTPAPSSTPAASPTPSGDSPPTTPTPTPESSPSLDLGFDYSSIFEGPTPVVVPVQPAVQPGMPPAVPTSVEPSPTPAVAVPAVEPATAQPAEGQQGSPPGPQAPPSGQGPQYNPADPLSLARALQENEAEAIEHVARTMFALSPEDIGALEADVAGTVPKLLAKVMVRAQQQSFTLLSRFVPPMIQQHNEVLKRQIGHEDAFYKAWPSLDKTKHGALVQRYGAMYRQTNPDVPTEKMIQELGRMVSALAGVPIGTGAPAAATTNGASPPIPKTPGFVPAQPGAVGHSPSPEPGAYDFLGRAE